MALFIACTAAAAPHTLRVSDPVLAQALLAKGGKLIGNYGSFQIIESDAAPTPGASSRVQLDDDLNVIELNTGALDTRSAAARALRRAVAPFTGKRLHLLQFAGPVKADWIAALRQTGVRVVNYIPQNAYLVYGDAPALARLQAWARTNRCVRWDGDFANAYKIHPLARAAAIGGRARLPVTDTFTVQLVEDTNANPATLALIEKLKLAPVLGEFRALHFLNVIVRLPRAQLTTLAARPDVMSIQPFYPYHKLDECQDQIVAGNLAGGVPSGPGYLAWLAAEGFTQSQFTASGFVVDLTDSGIDNGTTAPGHFGLYQLGDPALASRVVYSRLEGTPNPGSTLEGCDGHGTLDAHIVAGYCDFTNGFPFTDAGGFAYGLGVCPFVNIGASVIFDPTQFTFPNYADLQSAAYASGARISANSWGAGADGVYDATAQAYDALVRDAQPQGATNAAPGNQQMVIVFSAGNSGPSPGTIDSPGSAKNVITVGAAENVRSLSITNGGNDASGSDGCGYSDAIADDANGMAYFSSAGPCADGRIKPDLVAPGTHVTGGVAQDSAAATNALGAAIACFNADGVTALAPGGSCGTPTAGSAEDFFPLNQQFYTVSSGTSQAAAAVAGACALLRQYFINHDLPPPSPAMTKAWLMNSARYLDGTGAGDSLWSPVQGTGELDLGMALDGVPRVWSDQAPAEQFTNTGQVRYFTARVADTTKPLRVTLAWTDAPGSTVGNALNNDLDLTVTAGGQTYLGNVFNGAYSTPGGAYDHENNVESVFLPPGLSGGIVVEVTAADINSTAVPGAGSSPNQDFALVIYNAVAAPLPVVTLNGATLAAENFAPTNGLIDPGETVTVAFALKNIGFADTTNLVVTLLPTNGVVAPSGPETYGTLPAGGGAVAKPFSFTALGVCGGSIQPVFQLQDGSDNLGTIGTTLDLGKRIVTGAAATNLTTVLVPAGSTSGPAAPYPSTVFVSGVTGTVSKVTVTLDGLTYPSPADIDALLAGPTGTNVMLMSDCGYGYGVSGVTLTFDDNAGSQLPPWGQIISGTFQPTSFSAPSEMFSPPAPPGPFGSTLSVFDGLDPNGTWSLYLQTVAGTNTGDIGQGWWLAITTSNNLCTLEPPVLGPVTVSNDVVNLTWSTIPGETYLVQYNSDLGDTNWLDLAPGDVATNLTASQSDWFDADTQRFYRVVLKP